MLIASKLLPGGAGLAPALRRRATVLALDWDTRQKSRFEATDASGRRIGVFLPRGRIVRGGDVLVAEDGSLLAVTATPQPLLVVTVGDGGAPLDLLRAAYHLGNRHVPLEVTPTRLQLEPDHVLAELLVRMGLDVAEAMAPFEPEAGAYESARPAAPHAHHDHGPAHAHGHDHGHDAGHGHDHGPAHDHDHDHAHGHAQHDHGHSPRPR